jgi:SAM-dependent methyltransferase
VCATTTATAFPSQHYYLDRQDPSQTPSNSIDTTKTPMGSIHDESSGVKAAPASVFDGLTSAYDQVYSQGTLQVEYVQKLISRLSPGQSVLDIGCATGVPNGVLLEKAGLKVTGIDFPGNMIKQAKQNVPSGDYRLSDAKSFVPDQTYDAVVCSLALLSEPSLWVDSLAYRVSSWLKPTGLLLFGTIDFNDFPVAPGCPVDPSGLTFHHTFMETSITDSTFEPGDWIKILRRAGLRLLECDQRIFNPKPGKIEPELQCYFLASKTAKHALLGPYMHPYKHFAMPRAPNSNSWDFISRRLVADSAASWFAPGAWRVSNPTQLHESCPEGVARIELDWVLDMAPPADTAAAIRTWAQQSSSLEEVILVQASPSNQAITLVNSVARSLAPGTTQHHGSLISEFLSCLQDSKSKSGFGADSGIRIDLLPASLDFTDLPAAAFVENVARVFGDVWFAGCRGEDADLARPLLQRRVQVALDESASLGLKDVGRVSFDCVAVSVDVKVCRRDGVV